jgi:hypothetical protein
MGTDMKALFKWLYRRARMVRPNELDWSAADLAEDAIEEYLHLNGRDSLSAPQTWALYDAVYIALQRLKPYEGATA